MTFASNKNILNKVTHAKIMQQSRKSRKSSVCSWCIATLRGMLSEFLATALLMVLGCMSCVPAPGIDTSIYGPFGFGCVVMFNVQIFGHISGAFMNPAVTLASVIWGNTSILLGILYIIMEVAGALAGYGLLLVLSPIDLVEPGVCVTRPYPGMNYLQTLGIEIILTAELSFVCVSIWDPINEHKQDSTPIKFGIVILGLSLMAGALTGASMNPARSLAPAVWTGHWTQHWVYWAGPFIGSALAAYIYKYIFYRIPTRQNRVNLNDGS